MAQEKWITEMLAQRVRRDLHRPPPDGEVCFYGNPLGRMAQLCFDRVPEKIRPDTGSAGTIWGDLIQLQNFYPIENSTQLNNLARVQKDAFKLLVFWEWLRSLEDPTDKLRFPVLQVHKNFTRWLWGGYEIAMVRALKFAEVKEDNAGLTSHLPIDGIQNANEVASFLHQLDKEAPFILHAVPVHVALMLVPKLKSKDPKLKLDSNSEAPPQSRRGSRLQTTYMKHWGMGIKTSTPKGLRLHDMGGLGFRKDTHLKHGRCPIAQLIVAAGIEKFLRSSDNYEALMQAAWSNAMHDTLLAESHDYLASLETMAEKLVPRQRQSDHRYAMTCTTTEDVFSRIKTANAVWVDGEIQIEFLLAYQDWLNGQLLDAAVVIQTWGDIDGRRQYETIDATVLSAEDADESGDTMTVQVGALFSQTPLLNLWDQANPVNRGIEGVITLWTVNGRPRVVLGLDVYLGKVESPPTR